jgi:AcrR family transcriptional regulator
MKGWAGDGGRVEEDAIFGGADRLHLKQAEDGTAVGEVCRRAGISQATLYNWRHKYAGLMPSE